MSELALFPLSAPLFPGQRMELRVFEQRYLALVSRCLKNSENFGVVQIREGREVGSAALVFQVGVEASIVDWRQDNGVLGITVQGVRKFTLKSSRVEPDQLIMAEVSWLPDEPKLPIDDCYSGLLELCNQLRQHPMAARLQLQEPRYSCDLGWQLCQLIPLNAAEKVKLLSMSDPQLRLEQLAQHVDRLSHE